MPDQVETIRRMREEGASLRRIAADFECSPSTVLRVLHREGVVP
jgi:IS30 family transposase